VNKMFQWQFDEKALKNFKKLDKPVQIRVLKWLDENIQNTADPRLQGKALKGNFKTLWRYRVGGYRIIADIRDEMLTVLVLQVAKRGDVYKK